MKRALIIAALVATSAAHANNNEEAGQCILYGIATNRSALSNDALKVADNQQAAITIARTQMRAGNFNAWTGAGACRSIGLQASSYASDTPQAAAAPAKRKREPTSDELRNR